MFATLRPGSYALGPGDSTGPGNVDWTAETGADEQQFVLPAHRLRLRFRDEHGRDLLPRAVSRKSWSASNAQVFSALCKGVPLPRAVAEAPDMRGWGRLQEVLATPGTWWWFAAGDGDQHGDAIVQVDPSRFETEVLLTMRRLDYCSELRVELETPDGGRLQRAEVELDQLLPDQPGLLRTEGSPEALTFRCTAGRFRVRVQPEPEAVGRSPWFPIEREVVLAAGEETTLRLRAEGGGHAQLTVHIPGDAAVEKIDGLLVCMREPDGTWRKIGPYVRQIGPDDAISWWQAPSRTPFTCRRLLAPGNHVLKVEANGCRATELPIAIRSGEVTALEVWLEPK